MRIRTFSGQLGLALVLAMGLATTPVIGEPDNTSNSNKRRGPPPEALEACSDLGEGAACSFTGRRGEVIGMCFAPPRDESMLACAPEGGPPEHHRQEDAQSS